MNIGMYRVAKKSFKNRMTKSNNFLARATVSNFRERSGYFFVNFYSDIKSFDLPNQHFTNKLVNAELNNMTNSNLIRVLRYNNKKVKFVDSVFYDKNPVSAIKNLDFTHPANGQRLTNIFNYNKLPILDNYSRISIVPETKFMLGNQEDELSRVVYYIDFVNEIITVILIDPHHLLADFNPSKKYKEISSKSNYCLNTLYHSFLDLRK